MTITIWIAAMAAVALLALSPALMPARFAAGYPLALNIVVGIAIVTLAGTIPAAADHWQMALIALFLVGMAPLAADAWMDRAPPGGPRSGGSGSGGGDGGMDAMAGASVAASLAATSAASASWS